MKLIGILIGKKYHHKNTKKNKNIKKKIINFQVKTTIKELQNNNNTKTSKKSIRRWKQGKVVSINFLYALLATISGATWQVISIVTIIKTFFLYYFFSDSCFIFIPCCYYFCSSYFLLLYFCFLFLIFLLFSSFLFFFVLIYSYNYDDLKITYNITLFVLLSRLIVADLYIVIHIRLNINPSGALLYSSCEY